MSGLEGRDWSLLEATQDSLREHMVLAKELQNKIAKYDEAWDQHMEVSVGNAQYILELEREIEDLKKK